MNPAKQAALISILLLKHLGWSKTAKKKKRATVSFACATEAFLGVSYICELASSLLVCDVALYN